MSDHTEADEVPAMQPATGRDRVRDERIARRRDEGASWLQIQREFELTRQQARYSYQRGKREERRAARKSS